MPHCFHPILALVALALCAPARAQTEDLPRVGVLDLTSENVPPAEVRLLSDRLRVELFKTGQFTVIERQQMENILKEQGFQQSGCTATECVIEVGQLLGVEKMVAGSVGQVGAVYTISLRVINVGSGALERTAVRDCRCTIEDILTTTIAQAAAELAGTTVAVTTPLRREEGVGMLYIASNPPGAQIILDGRPRREVTPATLDRLPAGEHILRLLKEHLVAEQQVTIIRDDLVKLTIELHPGTGSLFVTSETLEAEVVVDGQRAGTTPLLLKDIVAGPHTVRVARADYLTWEDQVVVPFSERANVPAILQPCGYLDALVEPAGATISVDGKPLGRSPVSRVPLAVGEHRVVAALANYDSLEWIVNVTQGQAAPLRATLLVQATLASLAPTPRPPVLQPKPEPRLPVPERKTSVKSTFRWLSLAVGVAALGVGYKFNRDAKGAYDEAQSAYASYRYATNTNDAISYRWDVNDALERGRRAAKKRNIFYGIGGAGLTLGIILSIPSR